MLTFEMLLWNLITYMALLPFVVSIQLKIGVIIDEAEICGVLPPTAVIDCSLNCRADILWQPMKDWTSFNIVRTGSRLYNEGAVAVYMIRNLSNTNKPPDWIQPLSGIGQIISAEVQSQNHSDYCSSRFDISDLTKYFSNLESRRLNSYGTSYSKMLMEILKELKWINAVLVYEDDSEFEVSGLTEQLQIDGIFLSMYKIDTGFSNEDIYDLLYHVYDIFASELFIIVVGGGKMLKRLMSEANTFDDKRIRETAMHYNSRWLLFHIDNQPLNDVLLSNLNNVAIVNLPHNTMALDIPENLTLQYVLENIFTIDILTEEDMKTCCLNETSIIQLHNKMREVILQTKKTSTKYMKFPLMTLMFRKGGRQWNTIGHLHLSGDTKLQSEVYPNVNYGFNGKLFIVSTLEYRPFEYLDNETWNGLCIDFLIEMSRNLNFTYKLRKGYDGEWGRILNGSWTGLVGELQRRDTDMTFAPLSVMANRERVMDFTLGFFFDQTVIMLKKPDETKWLRLIEPLRWEVIILTGSLIPIISVVLFFAEKFNPFYTQHTKIEALYNFSWYLYGCVFLQGGTNLPRSQTGRTIICCWWLFCIILSATYCGNLIAYLTVTKEELPFDTLRELAKQDEYEWGVLGGTYWVTWFEQATVPYLQAVWNGMIATNQTDPRVLSTIPKVHMQKLREGNYAYIAEKSYFEIEASFDCDLKRVNEEFLPLQYAIGLPNNSPYTNIFSIGTLNILESGLIQIWKQKHWPKRNFCLGSMLTEAKPIKWTDIQIAFGFLCCGIVLSIIFLFIEYMKNWTKRSKLTGGNETNLQNSSALSINMIHVNQYT
ncbi:glutamate receptor ionotropic, kainate 4-like isoform X1 [Mytilus galloprovincialis]|uniref:glutamate receptor ionotropic, kainate 4-like isoform X1 n=1 Tax=Mytilus galloprovincialis TaxID=29158 RepID=UPI003F7BEA8F